MKKGLLRFLSFLTVFALVLSMGILASASAVKGDINNDGECTVRDALIVIDELLNKKGVYDADVNGDGKVSLADIFQVFKLTSANGLLNETANADVSVDENGTVSEEVSLEGETTMATVPAGVTLEEGATSLTLSVKEMTSSEGNVTLGETEASVSYDVHIEGVSKDNTTVIIVKLGAILPIGQNDGNVSLYHVEDGVTNEMTVVDSLDELDAHNEFYYNVVTGEVTVALATFSEILTVSDTVNAWDGSVASGFAGGSGTKTDPYIIANANQLAYFGKAVGGMLDGKEANGFAGEYVKLIADINLGDDEENNKEEVIFHPIGYYYENNGTPYSTVYSFEGTFDGAGHTIKNFYQNTWEIKGDYDGNYYNDAMGLFGYVVNGTVKNLTVDHFSSDGEYAPTGVIAAYAVNSTFENIAITNCNPRVYNTGNGGIVGIGGNTSDPDTYKLTFTNITIDNTNKITALWGSWDVACGGLVGMFRGAGYAYMTNCHVAAQIDVYNDVCGNYQYYWYRYSGMMIGTNKNMITDDDGYTVPETSKFHAEGCTVHFGDWNDYYYCELVANSLASYTHDHQFSRLTQIESIEEIKSGDTWTKTGNFLLISGVEKTCYHIVKDSDGTLKQHSHEDAGEETVNGETVLKEDKQIVYLPFNQLFTGYGWGVKHIPVYNGEDYAFEGITILDREVADSVVKFESNADVAYETRTTVAVGELFKAKNNAKVAIIDADVMVFVSPVGNESTVNAVYEANTDDWTKGTITFSGVGAATVTITDYYFCTPTTIEINVEPAPKFDVVMNNGDFLHRVGNNGTVALDKLFKAKDGVAVGTVSVDIEAVNNTGASGTYASNAIQFSGTGVVKVTIKDDDESCKPTELFLEVVDATNATGAMDAKENNVVLLNDIGSGFAVSGDYTFYGNGFTLNYTGNGQYLNNGLKQGVVTVSENGTLDNLKIKASIYPRAYMYYGMTVLGDYVQGGPSSTEGDRTRYHYQLSAVVAKGNATVSNCYIYGGRTNIFVDTGDVTVKDTILECGTVANAQIQSTNEYTVTFENVTTIQYRVNPTIDNTSNVMLGAGILVGPETTSNPTIVLDGEFKQYNWVTEEDENKVSSDATKKIIGAALDATAYNHTVNGKTSSNLGIIYMNEEDATVENNTGLPYVSGKISLSGANGKAYSLQNATENQIYSDYVNADKTTVNGLYKPQFAFATNLGGQHIPDDGGDEFCYIENNVNKVINVMFPSGSTKELDLAAMVDIVKYTGQNLNLAITCKDSNENTVAVTNGKITLSAAGEYKVTYSVTDSLLIDKDGKTISGSRTYFWDVTITVSLKDTALPDAYFKFDSTKQKMGYYVKSSILSTSVYQYIPFLAGLKIYDHNGQAEYLRFDGDADYNKVAKIEVTNKYSGNDALVKVTLTDGGIIELQLLARADSGGGSTYTGSIKTSNNTIYFVNDGTTSEKDATTTAAYWYVDYYKFTGNNGVTIQSAQQTFNSTGSGASTPSGSFSTSIKYTVTYDANGGNSGQTTGYATSANAAVTLPTPTRSGYLCVGWYTAANGGTKVGNAGDSYTPSADVTLYAQWGKPSTVTYDANGGSCDSTSEKYSGLALTLPAATRDGYWFVGWYDAANGGTKIGDSGTAYNPTGDITLYAHWQEKIEYTVTYDANGGSCGTASATYQGTALTLPTPTRTGYKFLGWYTAASGGTKIGDAGATYTPSANITLYAQWEALPTYTITISKQNNATVTVDKNSTYAGDTVSVTVSFSQSNNKTLTVKDANGNTILSKSAAGTYTFTMPESKVTIEASSEKSCVTPDTLVMLADGTQKRIDEVTYSDNLLVWDFFNGEYASVPASIIFVHEYEANSILSLKFEDGTIVKTIEGHGFFDVAANDFVIIDEDNVESYFGHGFVKVNGAGYTTVKLVDYSIHTELTEVYSIQTAKYINFMVEGMLSITPPPFDGWFDYFEIGDGMKYDEVKMNADIEKYGLYEYDDFADYVTYEQFIAFNGPYLKVLVGRGVLTYDQIIDLIYMYVNN